MRVLYFDCFSGISGDMALGALLDLGVDKDYLLDQLRMLGLEHEYEVNISKAQRKGITGTRFEVKLLNREATGGAGHHGRTLKDIRNLLEQSGLAGGVTSRSLKIFQKLAEAEAKIHGTSVEKIHFHEVGAVDSLLDIVGVAICLEFLQVDRILASRVELGSGFVSCEHGILPVPAPAVTEILRGVPVKTGRVEFETTTPTGAAILATNVDEYTDQLDFRLQKVGYGVGQRDLEIPNLLRVYLAEVDNVSIDATLRDEASSLRRETQWMVETNIDDMNPEFFPYVEEKLQAAGALDVFKTPIIMKNGRSATKLSVLATQYLLADIKQIIFRETTAIGLRCYQVEKSALERKVEIIETKYGSVPVKFSYWQGELLKYKPEYRDCQRIAEQLGIPLREIYKEIELSVAKK